MIASNVMLEYWSRHSPRITISQIQSPAWGHSQWFVWSGIACTGETRKYSSPSAWVMGSHTSLKCQKSPLDYWVLWISLPLNPKSLSDSCAKTGTYLQIITVCPDMHSTLSKKYKTFCVWDLLPYGHCFVFLSWLENWPLRNSDKCTVKKYYASENFN